MSKALQYNNQNETEISAGAVPQHAPLIALRNAVVFPSVLLPIFVGRSESIGLIEEAGGIGSLIALFTQRSPKAERISKTSLYTTGTLAEIHRIIPMSEGGYQVFLQGIQKIKLESIIQREPYFKAKIRSLAESKDISLKEAKEFQQRALHYISKHPGMPDEIAFFVKGLDNPSALANQILFFSQKNVEERMRFLKMNKVSEKVRILNQELQEESNRIHMEQEVKLKVEQDTNRIHKEYYLRKQLEVIRKELGEVDEGSDDLEKQLGQKWLPQYMRAAVDKELRRLRRSQEGGPGATMEAVQIRNWLELVLELPWEPPAPKEISLLRAGQILDKEHAGLEETKQRILEFLAVEKQTKEGRAPILCLLGPPGVGKTSLALSVAHALQRPYVRAALGGVRDEAEIRGHRRTYVGALPGAIIKAMKKAKSTDPVFLLDEIDKTSHSAHGDPSSALLEVLDPEQNHAFEDHYLGEAYDLSRVFFIATANSIENIPLPLQDRMEIVKLSGYTMSEKSLIAKQHLLSQVAKDLDLAADHIHLTEGALEKLIRNYTREAGVRELKRKLEALVRASLYQILYKEEKTKSSAPLQKAPAQNKMQKAPPALCFDVEQTQAILGRELYHQDYKENLGIPGVAVGLAWTPVGGDILFVEAASYDGDAKLRLSGQLGDVMKESAYIALSFLRTHSQKLGISAHIFSKKDVHVHIPSGAIPKDGPSAGLSLLAALSSLFCKQRLSPDIAMTGEISLRGRILAVGGVKEKLLAAKAAGIRKVLLPEKNRTEVEELPAHVRSQLELLYHSSMLEFLEAVLPARSSKSRSQLGSALRPLP